MSSRSNDLKTRLVVAATAALGLTAGCSSSEEEPAAAAPAPTTSDTSGTEAIAPPTEVSPDPAPEGPAGDSLDLDEDAEDALADSEAEPVAPVQRRARPGGARGRTGGGRSPAQGAEATCGASCGAGCSGVPGEEDDE